MSKYSAFYGRHSVNTSHKDSLISSTKRQAHNLIMNSPTLSSVELMKLTEEVDGTFNLILDTSKPSIVSDKETFYKRTMLFLPDEEVLLGSYLKYDDKVYLATGVSDIDIYPQAFTDFCNHKLLIKGETIKRLVGTDNLGRPKYETISKPEFYIPCVATSKIYSSLDNSQIPLPTGAIMIYAPYHEKIKIHVNSEFDLLGDKYKITTVNPINTLTDKDGNRYGYLEIRAQREVNSHGV